MNLAQIFGKKDLGNGKQQVTLAFKESAVLPRASGAVLQKYAPNGGTRYTSYDTPIYGGVGKAIPKDIKEQIVLARELYMYDPIIGPILDVLVQFSFGPIEHVAGDKKIKDFFDAIYETSNLNEQIKDMLLDYYVSCNVFTLRSEKGLPVKARNGVSVPLYQWTCLNTEKVKVTGPILFDDVTFELEPDETMKKIQQESNKKKLNDLIKNLPKEVQEAIRSKSNVKLPYERTRQVARFKAPYAKYGTPFVMRAVEPLSIKRKLLEADLSTADGIINQLVTVTIGNDMYPANEEQLKRVAEIFNTPSKAYTAFWNHTLEVKFHKPDANFFDSKKYEQCNRDIENVFGIVRPIFGNQGRGGASEQVISIKGLIQWLEWGRDDLIDWLEKEYKQIAEENGLASYPKVKFKKMNLQEDSTVKNVLLQLFDRGILSAETLLEETGHELSTELEKLKEDKKIREKEGLLQPNNFNPNPSGGRPDGEKDSTPRKRKDQVEPHGTKVKASYRDRVASSAEDQEEKKTELTILYALLLDELNKKALKTQDPELLNDSLKVVMSDFAQKFNSVNSGWVESNYSATFEDITGMSVSEEQVAVEFLEKAQEWQKSFADGFVSDLYTKLSDAITEGSFNKDRIQLILQSEAYRLPLYIEGGLKKGIIYAEVVGYGNFTKINRGRWNATFEKTCDECADRHGQIYGMDELLAMFPLHNHCECFIDWLS